MSSSFTQLYRHFTGESIPIHNFKSHFYHSWTFFSRTYIHFIIFFTTKHNHYITSFTFFSFKTVNITRMYHISGSRKYAKCTNYVFSCSYTALSTFHKKTSTSLHNFNHIFHSHLSITQNCISFFYLNERTKYIYVIFSSSYICFIDFLHIKDHFIHIFLSVTYSYTTSSSFHKKNLIRYTITSKKKFSSGVLKVEQSQVRMYMINGQST